ncbi:SpoIID/LytB domain-containing protein [Desertibacillus haloalkaliphilus]|uniref:SpoIID/LytB domain-containing protein n=1 Tax=Desertibacillus haloalkaliphilus TaxID=1328930 RepID=UPI001C26F235|nr:SpoIID/LytB domain-containing protein [Desertibacillus haloalkaliphilus]
MNNTTTVNANSNFRVKLENDKVALYEGSSKLMDASSLTFVPNHYNTDHQVIIKDRPYLGTMEFTREGEIVRPINTLPIEDYLKGVVPHEMPASWNIEALKVQAVAARTYAMSHGSRVIDDSINFQVYAGYTWHPNSTRAVNETAGQTLMYNNRLASAVYSSSNGGLTESNANLWGGTSFSYLPVQEDPYDPIHPWEFTLHKTQIDLDNRDLVEPEVWWNQVKEKDTNITANIKSWLMRNGYPNTEIKIVSVPRLAFSDQLTSGDRVTKGDIEVEFLVKTKSDNEFSKEDDGSIRIHKVNFANTTAQQIRSMIGINFVRTYLINDVIDDGQAYKVTGRGFGHGVGMSQWGSKYRADEGHTYTEILNFYYPGTTLTQLQAPEPIEQKPEQTEQPDESPATPQPLTIVLRVDHKQATVNGETVQLPEAPYIRNGRTLIPLRFVSEQLGAIVHWDEQTRDIIISAPNKHLNLRGGSRTVIVNGSQVTIDVAPEIIRGTTFVPLRFISEQIGSNVHWNPQNRTVTVTNR